jgi:hypothetical protein
MIMDWTTLRKGRGKDQDGSGSGDRPTSAPGLFVFFLVLAAGIAAAVLMNQPAPAIGGAVIAFYFLFAIQVAQQWEKVALLRFGRYIGCEGPDCS